MIGADTRVGRWDFLKARFGYTDVQIRPYAFSLALFLSDRWAIQQGYLGSEPYTIRQEAKIEPMVLSLADAGCDGYGSLISASTKLIQEKPELVQRFLDASIRAGTPACMATRRPPTPPSSATTRRYRRPAGLWPRRRAGTWHRGLRR